MANPRKFSEKIALHNQKMQEETAAFEKIMREVCDVKKVEDTAEFQTTTDNDYNKKSGPISSRESRGRNIGVGGPIRSRPSSRNIDTSPYSGNCVYLSPPNDSSWRRTNSDSAIHKTYNQQNQESLYYNDMHSTHSLSTVNSAAQREIAKNYNRGADGAKQVYNLLDARSRSATGIPCMPGINIYPSPHDKTLQIQIGNNTGSLPDLSSVHFPPTQNANGSEQSADSNRPTQSNEMNTYNSNSSFLSPTTGGMDKHLSADYAMSGMNIDIKSPKDLSSQYTTIPQNLQTYTQLYHTDNSIQKTKQDDLSNVPHQGSNENLIQQQSMMGGMRSPHRSSAGSSPRLGTSFPSNMKYFGSAPNSPTSTILSNGENYEQKSDGYFENQSIHHDFAQFTLVDTIDHIGQSNNLNNYNQFQSISYIHDTNMGMDNSGIKSADSTILSDTMCLSHLYDNQRCDDLSRDFSPSHQLSNAMKKACGNSTNIPDIEITDYSTGIGEFSKDTVRSLDLELGHMDFAGLQMLNDTNIITDPTIEDSFRRDIH